MVTETKSLNKNPARHQLGSLRFIPLIIGSNSTFYLEVHGSAVGLRGVERAGVSSS